MRIVSRGVCNQVHYFHDAISAEYDSRDEVKNHFIEEFVLRKIFQRNLCLVFSVQRK